MREEQARQVLDVKILQKVNQANREAFREKLPGQSEHLLRLITERLHLGLDKRDGVRANDPDTWILSASEIEQLSVAMYNVYQVYKDQNNVQSLSAPSQRHE